MPDKPAKSSPATSSTDSPDAARSASKGAAKTHLRKAAKAKPAGKGAGNKGGDETKVGGAKKQRAKGTKRPADAVAGSAAAAQPPPRKRSQPTKRKPPRQTFLVAATLPDADGAPRLRVYAAVVRGPAEALAAVRAELGPETAVELTGKLSNRMARALGLEPDEVRPV